MIDSDLVHKVVSTDVGQVVIVLLDYLLVVFNSFAEDALKLEGFDFV